MQLNGSFCSFFGKCFLGFISETSVYLCVPWMLFYLVCHWLCLFLHMGGWPIGKALGMCVKQGTGFTFSHVDCCPRHHSWSLLSGVCHRSFISSHGFNGLSLGSKLESTSFVVHFCAKPALGILGKPTSHFNSCPSTCPSCLGASEELTPGQLT